MSGFSSFAVSFSIISVLTGVVTTFSEAFASGGPAGLGLGWPLVTLGTLLVALAMAELASAFPTAGALYHWAALLGGKDLGWLTAATNLLGQFAVTAAIDLGLARELGATLGLEDAATLPLLVGIVAAHAVINAASVRLVARLSDLSALVHVVGVVVVATALLVLGRSRPLASLAFEHATTRVDGSTGLGFLGALLLGMYTFTGYDASAHLAEETEDAARKAPRGIVSAVLVSGVFGYALVAALVLAVRDLPHTMASPHAALDVLDGALGPRGGRAAMALALAAMSFCGLSSMTSASRTLYAFARDGGAPRVLARVDARTGTPVFAIGAAAASPLALVALTRPLGEGLFVGVVSAATMALYVSYALPVGLALVARLRGRLTVRGPFSLGRASVPVGAAAVAWAAFVLVVGALPDVRVLVGLVAALAALGVTYVALLRASFRGPPVRLEDL